MSGRTSGRSYCLDTVWLVASSTGGIALRSRGFSVTLTVSMHVDLWRECGINYNGTMSLEIEKIDSLLNSMEFINSKLRAFWDD